MSGNDTGLGTLDAGRLAELFRSGDASPLEATRAALDRIERFNDKVNAYVYADREGAEDAARASALKQVIDYAGEKGDIWFARRLDIAHWWLEHHAEFATD